MYARFLLCPVFALVFAACDGTTEPADGAAPANTTPTPDVNSDCATVDCDDPACAAVCDSDGDGHDAEAYGGADCNDADAAIHPDAIEVCNDVDDDCNQLIDDGDAGLDLDSGSEWHVDQDLDGYGDPNRSVWACIAPKGALADSQDCNDTDDLVHPDGIEVCNGYDDDCDGLVDGDDPTVDLGSAPLWYPDGDGDGYGDPYGTPVPACDAPPDHAGNDLDCNDLDPEIHPGALEVDGDGIDSNCDSLDDAVASLLYVMGMPSGAGGDNMVMGYTYEPGLGLTSIETGPWPTTGQGDDDRHGAVITPLGDRLYVTNNLSSTLDGYDILDDGSLQALATTGWPVTGDPQWIALDPTGRFLYASTSSDVIDAFSIDPATGDLSPIAGSPFPILEPRDIEIHPSGAWMVVAHMFDVDEVSVHSIDPATGALTLASTHALSGASRPKHAAITPDGQYVYVRDLDTGLYGMQFDAATGTLSDLPGFPVPMLDYGAGLTMSRDGKWLWTTEGLWDSSLRGYAIQPDGTLIEVPGSPVATGGTATYITTSADDASVLLTSEDENQVEVFTIDTTTGQPSFSTVAPNPYSNVMGPLAMWP